MPNYTACIDNNNCATVCAMQVCDKKTQADIKTMNTALADIFLEAMSSQVHAFFQQRHLCEPNTVNINIFL